MSKRETYINVLGYNISILINQSAKEKYLGQEVPHQMREWNNEHDKR